MHNANNKERKKYVIEIGKWKPDVTDLNTFLCNFETSAIAMDVTGEMKALEITRCLEGAALELIQNLSIEERLDYEAIKSVLQQRFRYTEGYYRKQFKSARTRPGESQKSLVDRITMYLKKWVELSGLEMTVEGLTELLVKDSYFLSQSREIQVFLKEAGKQSLDDIIKRCENYREAHGIHGDEQIVHDKRRLNRGKEVKKNTSSSDKPQHDESNLKTADGKSNHNAGEYKSNNFKYNQAGAAYNQNRAKGGCFVCGSISHRAFSCPQRATLQDDNKEHRNGQQHKVAACKVIEETNNGSEWNEREFEIPGIRKVPIIAAMSNSRLVDKRHILNMRNNYTSYGTVNDEEVEFLRDTGSSVSIVRSALVKPEQYADKEVTCLLVDHCVKKCPQAIVEVETKFYQGSLPVVCMDRCIYDLIIENDINKHGVESYE